MWLFLQLPDAMLNLPPPPLPTMIPQKRHANPHLRVLSMFRAFVVSFWRRARLRVCVVINFHFIFARRRYVAFPTAPTVAMLPSPPKMSSQPTSPSHFLSLFCACMILLVERQGKGIAELRFKHHIAAAVPPPHYSPKMASEMASCLLRGEAEGVCRNQVDP